jgi:hypothetical protein
MVVANFLFVLIFFYKRHVVVVPAVVLAAVVAGEEDRRESGRTPRRDLVGVRRGPLGGHGDVP